MDPTFLIIIALGYLLGSIPFGLLIGKARGIDIRTAGSGNIGSTNVARLLGRKWGYLCFALDVAKGLAPVLYAALTLRRAFDVDPGATLPLSGQLIWLTVAAACILGHMFSLYLRFHGGKAVATSLGVLLGIWPYFTLTALVVLAVWVAVWGFFRYVSLASIIAALAFPAIFVILIARIDAWLFHQLWPLFTFSALMALLVILRHRTNIARLLQGTENRGTTPNKSQ